MLLATDCPKHGDGPLYLPEQAKAFRTTKELFDSGYFKANRAYLIFEKDEIDEDENSSLVSGVGPQKKENTSGSVKRGKLKEEKNPGAKLKPKKLAAANREIKDEKGSKFLKVKKENNIVRKRSFSELSSESMAKLDIGNDVAGTDSEADEDNIILPELETLMEESRPYGLRRRHGTG
jgi:hypothetical protein